MALRRHELEDLRSVLRNVLALCEGALGSSAPAAPVSFYGPRRGGDPARARDYLRQVGKPVHIKEILEAIGREPTPNAIATLARQLTEYARKGRFFTKPEPNTFGLTEWQRSHDLGANAPAQFRHSGNGGGS